jgi:hypothetical protein
VASFAASSGWPQLGQKRPLEETCVPQDVQNMGIRESTIDETLSRKFAALAGDHSERRQGMRSTWTAVP